MIGANEGHQQQHQKEDGDDLAKPLIIYLRPF
jgi:hypothetical protein